VPSLMLLLFYFLARRFIENSPADAGFDELDVGDGSGTAKTAAHYRDGAAPPAEPPPSVGSIVKKVLGDRVMLTIAVAEFCTGFVRNGTDEWFPRFMQEVFHVSLRDPKLLLTAVGAPLSAIAGGMIGGWASDKYFQSRRAPVALFAYLGQAACMLFLGRVSSLGQAGLMLVVNSFFVQCTHGMLTGVASMDFGGRKAAATAAGFFDGCQYFAGAVGGFAIGRLVSKFGWGAWPPSLVIFALLGATLMGTLWNAKPGKSAH
jgi:OPA family glycerol-3-phosphate transporter-like MFS transporter